MREQPSASQERVPWPRYEAADLGFRHYWYPAMMASHLRKKPKSVTLLGERIALFRDGKKVYALQDRCPHRGVPLSAGRRECVGTISCSYHGWTYELATGELIAALTDGPDSPICGRASVRVKTYPVEERVGLIWVYVGDEPHPPVEKDIPEELLMPDAIALPMVDLRKGDWRYAMENAVDESHAKYLHRNTPFYFFYKFPGSQTDTRMTPDPDGVWLRRSSKPVFESLVYPRIGKWPPQHFWRCKGGPARPGSARGAAIAGAARLPAIFHVGRGRWSDYQIFVPVDRKHHLTVQISVKRAKFFGDLLWRLRFWTYIRYIHHILLNRREDGLVIEMMDCPPERLFRPDNSIVGWRRWCDRNARRSPAEASPPPATEQNEARAMSA